MDSGPLVVEIESFVSTPPTEDTRMGELAASLSQNYSCFKDDARKVHTYHAVTTIPKKVEKPRIGIRELSREAIARKEFLALINKLSPQNVDAMKQQCMQTFRPEFSSMYVDMLWDAMLRSPDYQHLYTCFLVSIDHVKSVFADLHRIWDQFLHTKGWLPISTGDSYDEFCDHVKAKKRAIASVRAWVTLAQDKLCNPDVASQLMTALIESGPTDVTLEELIEMYKGCPELFVPQVIHGIEHWHRSASDLPPMIRFKLYDLWELITKK